MAFTFLMFPVLVAIWGFLLFLFVLWVIMKFVTYVFQSFGLLYIAQNNNAKHPYLAWIPGVCNYILGEPVIGHKWSIGYAILGTLKNVLVLYYFFFLNNEIMFDLVLIYLVVYFVIDMYVMSRFYNAKYQHPMFFLISTILTLGVLKSIYIFTTRFKKA